MGSPKKPLVFAYYVTGHGFGHATRVVEIVRNLILAGHEVHVVTGAPNYVYTSEIQSPQLFIRKVLLDCGAVQADALTVDRLASLEKYIELAVVPREEILATEVDWLKSIKADFVVSDVVPVACRAAANAGIPAIVRNLILAGHEVHVVTGAPNYVYTSEIQSPQLFIRKVLLDCGAVQADALTVDRLASLEKYIELAVVPREEILATEVDWLKSIKADFVVSDVVPVACRAAANAGIPAVCCTNFRYEAAYASRLPESVSGKEFVQKYADHDDSVTKIDENLSYAVQAPTRHPVYENFRVKAFKALLSAAPSDHQLYSLGQLMYQCHYSYSACGLGSDGTDRLVGLVQEMQHLKSPKSDDSNLFGAKITGGGSGGTVCIIGRNCSRSSEQLFEIQRRYKAATGYLPYVFEGSSPGAGKANNASMPWNLTLSAEQSAAFGALRFHDFNLLIDEKRRAILEGAIEFFGSQHQSLA
nr:L-arabinokinase-like isoform X2 [Ipomoea batatas]